MTEQSLPAVIPFIFEERPFRVVNRDGEAGYLASDVAAGLGYRDADKLTRMLDDDEKGTHLVGTLGGNQHMAIITESGLWHAIFKSRRLEAMRLRRFITSEVLPALRRDGFFALPGSQRVLTRRVPFGEGVSETPTPLPSPANVREFFRLYAEMEKPQPAAKRRLLYSALDQMNGQLRFDLAGIGEIGTELPQPSDLLGPFFEGLDRLTELGERWDHARGAAESACSPREIAALFDRHEIDVRVDAALQAAARAPGSGIVKKTVNSAIDDHRRHCWAFASRKPPA